MSVAATNDLWVEKYRPVNKLDLIGNKTLIDNLIIFLKTWDPNGLETKVNFRSVLISGPPGIGKTSAAYIACKEAGYEAIEFNASDTRSKKSIEQKIKEILSCNSILSYFKKDKTKQDGKEGDKDKSKGRKKVLILDEIDGMSGGDRGGIQEIIKLLKTTKVPIICICNDRNSVKIKSLANHCFDYRFRRPTAAQIRPLIQRIITKEGLELSENVLETLVETSRNDIRQIINLLSSWRLTSKSMSKEQSKEFSNMMKKNVLLNPFDIASRYFNNENYMNDSFTDRIELYFHDYQLAPLMVQENYIYCQPSSSTMNFKQKELETLDKIVHASEFISQADLIEKSIHTSQNWDLMPLHAAYSCAIPSYFMHGKMSDRYRFPSWLGQNSKTNKYNRLLKQTHLHMKVKISGDKNELRQNYLLTLNNKLTKELIKDGNNGISKTIQLMDNYYLDKEDWDTLIDLGIGSQAGSEILKGIPTSVKSAFTRTYNKQPHPTMLNVVIASVKTKKEAIPDLEDVLGEGELNDEEEEEEEEEDDEDVMKDKLISKAKEGTAAKRKSKAAGTKATRGKKGKK
ncbi:RFC1-domain-containing protein [Neoconidiobolus thromboides FSU 785]|nr:RFC1-domain-containing protein [Neoconidiobolus thromboides FSU 785]